MMKDGGLSFETQLKIDFYHQITVVKNKMLRKIPECNLLYSIVENSNSRVPLERFLFSYSNTI